MNGQKPRSKNLGAMMKTLFFIAPFFLPTFLFQTGVFSLLSPLPLFLYSIKKERPVALIALLSNIALCYFLSHNSLESAVFGGLLFFVGIVFPNFIRISSNLSNSLFVSYLLMVATLAGSLTLQASSVQMNAVDYVRAEVSLALDQLIHMDPSPIKNLVDELGREDLYREILIKLPSGVLVGALLCLWINLLFASQFLPGLTSKAFWSKYKNPEWFIWPTLAFGALYVYGEHALYYIGFNGFNLMMVFYAIQGLSIVIYALNRFQIQGLGRLIIMTVALLLANIPVMILGIGDLWFDFRRKFRQI